jgi:hypothetical protein
MGIRRVKPSAEWIRGLTVIPFVLVPSDERGAIL